MDDKIEISKKHIKELKKFFSHSEQVRFLKGVADHDGFPVHPVGEVCFAGRSNVGKSSLLNALTFRKNLARTSNTPGRTQEINYFSLWDKFHLVDLPGYGFAKAPKDKVDQWNNLIRDYLMGRVQLKRIFILIDARHGMKQNDIDICKELDRFGNLYQIILTKIDKISSSALSHILNKTKEEQNDLIACHPSILVTSSAQNIGLDEVRQEIMSFII